MRKGGPVNSDSAGVKSAEEPDDDGAAAVAVPARRSRSAYAWLLMLVPALLAVAMLALLLFALGVKAPFKGPLPSSGSTPPTPNPPVNASVGTPSIKVVPARPHHGPRPNPGSELIFDPPGAGPTESADRTAAAWNYWLETGDGHETLPSPNADALQPGTTQRLLFRLSSIDLARLYPAIGRLGASSELARTIAQGVADTSRTELRLEVMVRSVDERRLAVAPSSQRQPLTIDLQALRMPAVAVQAAGLSNAQQQVLQLQRATQAQFVVAFKLLSAGSHELGITVIDADSGYPLQTMTASISSGQPWPGSVQVQGSGQTLFSSTSPPLDLALYLYDLLSVVDGKSERSLQAELRYRDPATQRADFIAWQAAISMQGLVDLSETFRKANGDVSDDQDLRDAGVDLGRALFSPVPSLQQEGSAGEARNAANARRVRELIHRAAAYPAAALPPSMLVVIVSRGEKIARYASQVLPVSALGVQPAEGDGAAVFLGERFALALALSDQPATDGGSCDAEWAIAMPQAELADETALAAALSGLEPVRERWLQGRAVLREPATMDTLKQWMRDRGPTSGRRTVFTFLGHQADGEIYLRQGVPGINASRIERRFGAASIAILNACNSALSTISDGTPIGRLARQGVGATVATTSKVSGSLAAAYMDCLGSVLAERGELTIGQAQALTTQCLWDGSRPADSGKRYRYGGAALKYMLIGTPFPHICAPPGAGAEPARKEPT